VSKWTEYGEPSVSASGKTSIWPVLTMEGYQLGVVKWFGRWHQYAFYPAPDTVFERSCLRDIARFCEDRTVEMRRKKRGEGEK